MKDLQMPKSFYLLLAAASLMAAVGCGTAKSSERIQMSQTETIAECPYRLDGLPDTSHGWYFVAEQQKGKEYLPFEGWFESKGGKIQSPQIRLNKTKGTAGFFRLTFSAKSAVQGYWWVDLFDRDGRSLPDIVSSLYPSEQMQAYDQVLFTDSRAEYARISFVAKQKVTVRDIRLEAISAPEAAAWCDREFARLTSAKFTAPKEAFDKLPKTREALLSGKPWRIVMLGDSLVNDTWNSNFQSLVMRDFPEAKLDFIVSVRGSTGCWYYRTEKNFQEYVAAWKPDLVMIGGISNAPIRPDAPDPEENMITVIRRCRALGCEVLVMSPPRSWDWRTSSDVKSVWNEELTMSDGGKFLRRDYQRAAVAATGVAYWDLTTFPCDIAAGSGRALGWFNRDAVHNNDRGKQLIGQTLAAWFRAAKDGISF